MSAPLKFELDRRQGVINIGYGAGSSPSFTNLTVTNTLTVGGSVHGANGSAANPSFAFNSDQNTGLYRIGPDNIGVAVGGVKVLDIATTGLTVTGAVTVGGAIYSSSFLDATGGVGTPVSGHGQFSGSGAYGAVIAGYGSAYDFALFNRSGVDVLHVATNTTTAAFSGAATFAGAVLHPDGTAAAPSISFSSAPTNGIYYAGGNEVGISNNGILRWKSTYASATNHRFQANGGGYLDATSNGAIGLAAAGTNQNITLTPSGTGVVSASSVNFDISSSLFCSEVYSTATWASGRGGSIGLGGFTDSSNTVATFAGIAGVKESVVSGQTGGMLTFHSRASGAAMTERARILSTGRFLLGTTTDSGALLQIGTNTTTSAGGMVFGTDVFAYRNATNSFKLEVATGTTAFTFDNGGGGTGGARIVGGAALTITSGGANSLVLQTGGTTALTLDSSQTALFAGNVSLAANKSILFGGGTISNIYSTVDGVIVVANNANTGFSRLQFGGTTSSFPALARSGVRLIARLADDSSVAELEGALVSAGAAVTVGASRIAFGGTTSATVGAAGAASPLPALPTGYIIVNVAGTNMKVPYYAN